MILNNVRIIESDMSRSNRTVQTYDITFELKLIISYDLIHGEICIALLFNITDVTILIVSKHSLLLKHKVT